MVRGGRSGPRHKTPRCAAGHAFQNSVLRLLPCYRSSSRSFSLLAYQSRSAATAMKGKRVTYASTDRVDELRKVADDFMMEVFDFLPSDYLITDESSLPDFTEFASSDTSLTWNRISEIYAIGKADVPSQKLVDIFAEILRRRNVQ